MPVVPEPIDIAIEDAKDVLVHRVLDDPEADLRTAVLTAYYEVVASTYCAYHRRW